MTVKTGFGGASNDFYKPNSTQSKDAWLYDDTPSLTRQEFKDECDINNIMAQYQTTGVLPVNSLAGQAEYLDLTDMPENLADTLALLGEAETAFMRLPALVRREFDNDPVQFVDYASNPANLEQMRKWGLAEPLPPVQPVIPPADVAPAPAGKGAPSPAKAE